VFLHDDFDDMQLHDGPVDGGEHDGHHHPADGRAEPKNPSHAHCLSLK